MLSASLQGKQARSSLPDCCAFELHCTRKKNVVFQVYVEVKVLLEALETLVSSLVTCAGACRSLVAAAHRSDLPHQLAGRVVIFHHGMDRIPHTLEERRLNGTAFSCRAFERVNERKQNLFLFLHMHQHLAS